MTGSKQKRKEEDNVCVCCHKTYLFALDNRVCIECEQIAKRYMEYWGIQK